MRTKLIVATTLLMSACALFAIPPDALKAAAHLRAKIEYDAKQLIGCAKGDPSCAPFVQNLIDDCKEYILVQNDFILTTKQNSRGDKADADAITEFQKNIDWAEEQMAKVK
jgi:hypothetical protein